ncbi:MAG: hypothetical protein PHI49_03080 [Halothiobacillaceae bacterium]|nr:hypothetical protein [Halothiobacillaceae bacterium]
MVLSERLRRALLERGARLQAADPDLNCRAALARAASELGLDGAMSRLLDCRDLDEALADYQRLFRPGQPALLRGLRRQALEAMRFFSAFEPRLVGSVLTGTADENSSIVLHLFAETPEEVLLKLLERNIPFEESRRVLRYRGGRAREYPVFSFSANGVPVDLVVLHSRDLREAPLAAGDNGPLTRAGLRRVESLIAQGEVQREVGAP